MTFSSQIRETETTDTERSRGRVFFWTEGGFSWFLPHSLNWLVSSSGWFFLHSVRGFCSRLVWVNVIKLIKLTAEWCGFFFTFAFSVFMLCAFWLGTVFSSFFFATIYKYEKTTSTTSSTSPLSTCSWSSRNFEPRKLTRNGAAFLAKDSRKWLSYVCRSRFHALSLAFTLSRHDALSLLTFFFQTLDRTVHCLFFFYYFVWYLLALLQSTLAQTLFCLIVYVLWDPFFLVCVCLWRFENHGCRITCCKISNFKPIAKIWTRSGNTFFLLLLLLLLSSVVTHLKLSSHAEFRKENHDCCCCFSGIAFDTSHTSPKTQEPPGATPAAVWISCRIYTVPRSSP